MSKKALMVLVASLLLVSAVPAFAQVGGAAAAPTMPLASDGDRDDDGRDDPVAELVNGTPDLVADFVLCSFLYREALEGVFDPDCDIDND